MAAMMKAIDDMRRSFSNRREWREFASAFQCSVTSSASVFAEALKASARLSSQFWRWADPRASVSRDANTHCHEPGVETPLA
jgi:hypothetical protein